MPLRGRKFKIFGAFKSKKKAITCERKHRGAFIIKRSVRGHRRFVVMKKST